MRFQHFWLIFGVVLLEGCDVHPVGRAPEEMAGQAKVYSLILDSLYSARPWHGRVVSQVVLTDSTVAMDTYGGRRGIKIYTIDGKQEDRVLHFLKHWPPPQLAEFEIDSLCARFNHLNRVQIRLDSSNVQSRNKLVLLSTRAVEERLHRAHGLVDYWEQFYTTYPGSNGRVSLSQVAFNNSHTQAMTYWEHRFGDLGATGQYLFLEKKRHEWVVVFSFPLWES